MDASLDLPGSTNGALLVLSVAGFGLSVYLEELFLAKFFGGMIAVTGLIWLFFLSMTIYRNMLAFEEASDYRRDFRTEFLFFYIIFTVAVVGVLVIVSSIIG